MTQVQHWANLLSIWLLPCHNHLLLSVQSYLSTLVTASAILVSTGLTAAGSPQIVATPLSPVPPSGPSGLLVGKLVGKTDFEKAWSAATLYKNEAHPVIQLFQLTGRIQLQSIYGEAGGGDSFNTSDFKDSGQDEIVWGNDLEVRRARIGFKSKFFHDWKIEAAFNVDVDGHDGAGGDSTFYKNFHEGGLTYAPSEQLNIAIGKKQVRFSRDQEISSTEIGTFERSLLSNILTPGELTGAWTYGKGIAGAWHYEAGIFSNARVAEFAQPGDGGVLAIGKIGYDLAEHVGLESCITTFTYMHNSEPGYKDGKIDPNFSFSSSPQFTDSIALTNDLTEGRFGMITELTYGFGFTGSADQGLSNLTSIVQSDLLGITLTPSFFLTDKVQAVYRFQLVSAADPNGIQVPSRYDRLAAGDDEKGNTYMAHYLGINYLIFSHKLKLMGGVEYSQMGGGSYDGYTLLTGLRMNF